MSDLPQPELPTKAEPIDHWYQLHVLNLDEERGYFTARESEGPFDWDGLLDRVQVLIGSKTSWRRENPRSGRITRIDISEGARYEKGANGWNVTERFAALPKLPVYTGRLPLVREPKRGNLILSFYGLSDDPAADELTVWTFVEGDSDIVSALSRDRLQSALVFRATIAPVREVGVDLNTMSERAAWPDPGAPTLDDVGPISLSNLPDPGGLPIVGFRNWRLSIPTIVVGSEILDGEPKLHGPYYPERYIPKFEWQEAEKTAECIYFGHLPNHVAPFPGCGCGVYAVYDLWQLPCAPWSHPELETRIAGAVLGTGDILLHDHGWRSETARIIGFDGEQLDPKFLPALRHLAQKFEVPILSSDDLVQLALKKGKVILKEDLPDEPAELGEMG